MLRSFPPFPSPNPATMNQSPFENVPIVPSPPSSNASSLVSSPSSSPSAPASPTASSSTNTSNSGEKVPGRSRSRSTARKCAPSHSRIVKRDSGSSTKSTSSSEPHTPPVTPPLETLSSIQAQVEKQKASEMEAARRKNSVRTHHYEDAVRIACGAWGDSGSSTPQSHANSHHAHGQHKKKTVSWDSQVPT